MFDVDAVVAYQNTYLNCR